MCQSTCPTTANPSCYKAQCYKTSTLIADQLNLTPEQFSTSFQSRLGKTPWIRPYTDELLVELAERGIKNLAITSPSFVADCLETLEEIGLRAKDQWLNLGGEQFTLIPSLNSHPFWVKAIAEIINP